EAALLLEQKSSPLASAPRRSKAPVLNIAGPQHTSNTRMPRVTAKYRVIGNLVFDTELAEPAIGKVNLNLSANPSLGADRKHIADQQHPDHQHRINRRPTSVRVIRRELLVHPTQIEQPVDLPDQM